MKTTKLGLKKPDGTDLVNIQDFNENVEEIEKQLEQRPTKEGDASDMTATFTQASKVAQLTSGESIKASFGKIAKTIADYMSHKTTTATVNILGHVKLSDTFNSVLANGAAVNGMAASQKSVADAYMHLNNNLIKNPKVVLRGTGVVRPKEINVLNQIDQDIENTEHYDILGMIVRFTIEKFSFTDILVWKGADIRSRVHFNVLNGPDDYVHGHVQVEWSEKKAYYNVYSLGGSYSLDRMYVNRVDWIVRYK